MNGYYNPVHIIQGPGSAAQLPKILKDMQLPNRRVLLLAWGKAVFQDPFFSDFIGGDENFEICPKVFEASNPTVEQLFKIYRETEAFAPASRCGHRRRKHYGCGKIIVLPLRKKYR